MNIAAVRKASQDDVLYEPKVINTVLGINALVAARITGRVDLMTGTPENPGIVNVCVCSGSISLSSICVYSHYIPDNYAYGCWI